VLTLPIHRNPHRMSKLSRAARIILVGAPGVGKGTQTERLIKQFPQLSAISSGDLLRYNVRNRTALGGYSYHKGRLSSTDNRTFQACKPRRR